MFSHFWTLTLLVTVVYLPLRSTGEVVINSWLDFDCPEAERTGRLVYTKSVRSDTNSSSHFIWSTVGGFPAFFVVHTRDSENVTIDWNKLLKNENRSVLFGPESVQNTVGVLLSKMFLWEAKPDNFDEISDTRLYPIDLENISWDSLKNHWSHSDRECVAEFTVKQNHTFHNGSIMIKLKVVNSDQRYDSLPHLWVTERSMHIQVIVDKVQMDTLKNLTNLRLGFELMLFSSGNSNVNKTSTSIDDEFSPGIFQTYNLLLRDNHKSDKTSYLQWKPVIYSTPKMIISKMLQINAHKLETEAEIPVSNAALYGFLSGLDSHSFSMNRFNVTFGSEGEEFYSDTHYTNWNFVIGLGEPLEDKMSITIKLIIFVCFGLPAIALLILPVALIVHRYRRRKGIRLLSEQHESAQ